MPSHYLLTWPGSLSNLGGSWLWQCSWVLMWLWALFLHIFLWHLQFPCRSCGQNNAFKVSPKLLYVFFPWSLLVALYIFQFRVHQNHGRFLTYSSPGTIVCMYFFMYNCSCNFCQPKSDVTSQNSDRMRNYHRPILLTRPLPRGLLCPC